MTLYIRGIDSVSYSARKNPKERTRERERERERGQSKEITQLHCRKRVESKQEKRSTDNTQKATVIVDLTEYA